MKKMFVNKKVLVLVALALVAIASQAMAFTPAAGDPGWEFYDMANKMSTGAIGTTVGLGGMAMAAFFLFKQQVLPAIGTAMGGMAIAKSGSMMTGMGFNF